MSESRLVYSTESGDQRKQEAPGPSDPGPGDGIVRVFREQGGRRGKVVTVIRGLPFAALAGAASDLKRHCGAGGAVRDGAIELQGDHREKVAARLRSQGHTVKLAGG